MKVKERTFDIKEPISMSDSLETSVVINDYGMLFLFDICNSTEIADSNSDIDTSLFYANIQLITNVVVSELNSIYIEKTVICQSTGDGFYLYCKEPLRCIDLWKLLTHTFKKQRLEIKCGASFGKVTINGPSIGCHIGNIVNRCCAFSKEGGVLCITSTLHDLIGRSDKLSSPEISITLIEKPELKGLKDTNVYLIESKNDKDSDFNLESETFTDIKRTFVPSKEILLSEKGTEQDRITSLQKHTVTSTPNKQERQCFKWLHLSDLQFKSDAKDAYLSLLRDIEQYASDLDFIFVTGDIAFSGENSQYENAIGFFHKLIDITKVSEEHLFIVPGNHDIQRNLIQPGQDYKSKVTYGQYKSLIEGTPSIVFENFYRFSEALSGIERERIANGKPYYRTDIMLNGATVTVIGLISAGFSLSYSERDSIVLDERSVIEAYSDVNNSNIVITLLHHPVIFFNQKNAKTISQIISKHSTFVLHGHSHDNELGSLQRYTQGNHLTHYIAAGKTADDGTRCFFYNITSVNISNNECRTTVRRYEENYKMWIELVNGPEGGATYNLYDSWIKSSIDVNLKNNTIQIQPQTSIGYKALDKKTIEIPNVPRYLLNDIVAGKCVLFAGAGTSADGGLPVAGELVYALIDAVESNDQDGLEQSTKKELLHLFDSCDYEPIINYCKEKLGPTDFTRILREQLDCVGKESLVHNVISKIPFKMIITGNLDQFLEKYCIIAGKQYKVILPDNMNMDYENAHPILPIFKIHGTLEDPRSIKATRHETSIQYLNNSNFKDVLLEIFRKYTVLFVGTSFSDIDINLLLLEVFEKHRFSGKKHYALLPDVTTIEKQSFLKNYNLQVIAYDSSYSHIAACQFLEKLSMEVKDFGQSGFRGD